MKILYINSVVDFGSTGKIVRELSTIKEVESLIVYGRKNAKDVTNTYKVSNDLNTFFSMVSIILFNNELTLNKKSTIEVINKIKEYKPDIVHLNNLHGYYINYKLLFDYLNKTNIKLIWTFHDCWPITGYCSYFDLANCDKYKNGCNNCPIGFAYPYSLFKQNIIKHYKIKKDLFTSNKNLTIITPSIWLKNVVKNSYLKDKPVYVINNGIDLSRFNNDVKKNERFTILFVANYWTKTKGRDELEKIIKNVNDDIDVIIVGEYKNPPKYIKERCTLIKRTNNIDELASIYAKAHLFINPTLEEVLGLVNIEALACGTPVIMYNTGGSPETIDDKTGIVVDKYDYKKMAEEINKQYKNYNFNSLDCIERARLFSIDNMKKEYKKIYKKILNK